MIKFMVCPKCDSREVVPNGVEDMDDTGLSHSAECENCDAKITYFLSIVDAEYEGQYDEEARR